MEVVADSAANHTTTPDKRVISKALDITQIMIIDAEFNLIHKLIKKGNKIALESKLDAGLDPNLSNRFGWTLLMIAAIVGRSDITDLLLSHGADPKHINRFGDTAASLAKVKGFNKLADTLAQLQNERNG